MFIVQFAVRYGNSILANEYSVDLLKIL